MTVGKEKMTNGNSSDRLDRIERILEQTVQIQQQTEQKIASNAKSIESLTDDLQEMRRDRKVLYDLMSDLANNQSRMYQVMEALDERQQQLTNQQNQLTNQQQQLIEILKRLTPPQ